MRDLFKMETCSKCGMRAVAFICSTPGCPVNGGAAYGPEPTQCRSEPFEAAVRTRIEEVAIALYDNPPPPAMSAIDWLEAPEEVRNRFRHMACIAVAAALPPEPAPDEVSEAIGLAIHDVHEFPAKTYLVRVGQAARRALRATLLPEKEPS